MICANCGHSIRRTLPYKNNYKDNYNHREYEHFTLPLKKRSNQYSYRRCRAIYGIYHQQCECRLPELDIKHENNILLMTR